MKSSRRNIHVFLGLLLIVCTVVLSTQDSFGLKRIALDAIEIGGWGRPHIHSHQAVPQFSSDDEEEDGTNQLLNQKFQLSAKLSGEKLDPNVIRMKMKDGNYILGTLNDEKITVITNYGTLHVPIQKLRKFTPGIRNQQSIHGELESLLADLGGSDFRKRELAQKKLIEKGPTIRFAIEAKLKDPNVELVRRIAIILEKFSASEENETIILQRLDDVVETTISPYPLVGDITPKIFTVKTKYGELKVNLADIEYAERDIPSQVVNINKKFRVTGVNLAQLQFKKTRIKVKKGEKIQIRATGQLFMTPWGSSSISTPDGGSNFSTYQSNPRIYSGTLVARIGKNGKIVKAGSNIILTAQSDGELQFAIGMYSSYARGNYQFPGGYDVKVQINRSEKNSEKK